jgi:mRNA interferase RelE/StbE
MPYRVEVTPRAARELGAVPEKDRRRLVARIDALAEEPYPPGVKKLASSEGLLRIRVGDYRIVYLVEAERLIVLVVRVGHRREVYRR